MRPARIGPTLVMVDADDDVCECGRPAVVHFVALLPDVVEVATCQLHLPETLLQLRDRAAVAA